MNEPNTPSDAAKPEADATPPPPQDQRKPQPKNLWKLVLGCIGVVYGDIGTSPLYALRESLHAAGGDGVQRGEVLGVVSLLLWTLILIVTIKYVVLVMRADNRGEGGTLSLVALVQQALQRRPGWLLAIGVVGISLFFGDAMITPAMSVLSAVEGMAIVAPSFEPFVVPDHHRDHRRPVPVSGAGHRTRVVAVRPDHDPVVPCAGHHGAYPSERGRNDSLRAQPQLCRQLSACNTALGRSSSWGRSFWPSPEARRFMPTWGISGASRSALPGLIMVFPALALSYLGQGALVLAHPEAASDPFFLMVPAGWLLPLVILATAATVIASQAVISGAFSMMQQAVQMGLLPRLEIRHTSETQHGQIYMPRVNMILLAAVILLVVAFESSTNLASAYGIAVTGDMVITSILAIILFVRAWKWPVAVVAAIMVPILSVELLFLGANLTKLAEGGFVPVLFAGTMCLLIFTWVRGTAHVKRKAADSAIGLMKLIGMLTKSTPIEVPGTAVFLTQDPETAPSALLHNLKHNRVLHSQNFIVTVAVAPTPTVSDANRITLERLSDNFLRVILTFGYMETPNVPKALSLARKRGEKFDIMTTSFFLNRRSFRSARQQGLPFWQERVFIALSKSAADATAFYCLPSNRVVEMGQQMAI